MLYCELEMEMRAQVHGNESTIPTSPQLTTCIERIAFAVMITPDGITVLRVALPPQTPFNRTSV